MFFCFFIPNPCKNARKRFFFGSERCDRFIQVPCLTPFARIKEPIRNQKVKLANDKLAEIKSKGTAILFSYIKNKLEKFRLENALYVLELKANLISVSKVTANGKRIIFTNKMATIFGKKDEIVITAICRRDLYIVDTKSEYIGMVYENRNILMDWHYQYGHLNESDLRRLINKNMVNGLPNVRLSKMNTREICLKGKQH
ncbi:uncharacterized protein LOC117155661 isoform X2 [Bombus vancouverensis nearcticus]|uniref:uncharacterized protein LOC117155661 isoform X2 n=1 Tax=Bombus vancouverensis nearcticus TaxID=2705178 RepID=UPI00402B83EE